MPTNQDRCVLIVDDDPSIRLLLITYLRRRGYQLLAARNGREALTIMRAEHCDVVVMDLMMPEVSGMAVLCERETDPLLLRIPMIVVTANNARNVQEDVLDKHVYAVLGKPFDLDVLLETVTACLHHSEISDPIAA